MNDLIQRITNAIIRQEGMSPDHTNPGNLRDCPWFPILMDNGKPWRPPAAKNPDPFTRYYPDTKTKEGDVEYVLYSPQPARFWIPRSRAEGIAGAAHVVALHIAEGDSLRQLIGGRPGYAGWAPASDKNNTEAYIQHVGEWAQIPNVNLPLWNFIIDYPVPS